MTSDIKSDKLSYKKWFSKKSVLQESFTITLNNVTAISSNMNLNMKNLNINLNMKKVYVN